MLTSLDIFMCDDIFIYLNSKCHAYNVWCNVKKLIRNIEIRNHI